MSKVQLYTSSDESSLKYVYYPNGILAWDGVNAYKKLYRGELSDAKFYFRNRKQVWAGATSKDYFSTSYCYYSHLKIFHNNGNQAWKGVSHKECEKRSYLSYEYSYVCHSNGTTAWKGFSLEECKKIIITQTIIATFTIAMELSLGKELFLVIQMRRTPKFL